MLTQVVEDGQPQLINRNSLSLLKFCVEKVVEEDCGPNEWFDYCGNEKPCEEKCNGEEIPEEVLMGCLSRSCFAPAACVCEKGFYRDEAIGLCVPYDECNEHEIVTFAPAKHFLE
ncbi:trypsin Inhibitor like cysteine rich domain protein [Ancylostoma duodenale]|uniref:Trypsin Inhibitor like cysteine rich domain protein n=1 Tax=Ancylostoma duodenale TaxID=51022 RepID=A0A0C2DV70_9BILA|nr:trypsin Inhibitor like cysteine rich domain protein [Ancylostoma duodenale]